MKKTLAALLTIGLLVGLVAAAYAQSVGTTSTSIIVQNLSESEAQVTVDFWNTDGDDTGSKMETIAGEGSKTFDQRQASGDPGEDPFQGAAIVSSSQPVGAVVQMVRTGGSGGVNSYDSYNGITEAAQMVKAPLILKNISSAGKFFNTTMAIQNTDTEASADVTVTFTPMGVGTADTETFTIPAGGSKYLMQEDQTGLGSSFFGSAEVTVDGDQKVAVAVTSGADDGSSLIAYPTYTEGSLEVNLPGVQKNIVSQGDLYFTSITIVNMGETGDPAPDVTVEYQPLSGTTSGAYDTGAIDSAVTIDLRSDPAITSDTFYGAVKLTNEENSTPFAAMLNWRGDDPVTGDAVFATTYGGATGEVTTAYVPYLLKMIPSAGYNWSSTIFLQNLADSGDLDVEITYKDDTNTYTSDEFEDITDFTAVDLRYDPDLTPATFFGGAKIESTNGAPFAVVVLVRGSGGTGDALSSYVGVAP